MTRKIALAATLLTLAACAAGTATAWLKPGVDADLALRDEARCAAEARRAAPVDRRIATSPSITVGIGVNRCVGALCAGLGTGREVYDTDRNEQRRDQLFGACMGRAGYTLVTLPRCAGTATPLASHPFDTRGICVGADGRLAGN